MVTLVGNTVIEERAPVLVLRQHRRIADDYHEGLASRHSHVETLRGAEEAELLHRIYLKLARARAVVLRLYPG